jgi:hypothetical protein
MTKGIAGRLATDSVTLPDLNIDIAKGEIKIPQFQRKFVWREEQALQLLDSIANNYPIGSVLLWRTHDKLATERNIGNFRLPETEDLSPTSYVLDGQQRLTVIYSSLGANIDDEGFAAAYDLLEEKFLVNPLKLQITVFPIRYITRTTNLLNFRSALQSHPQAQILQSRLDDLIGVFTKYKIPVVTLKELKVEEVCPIFERINSSGTRLSTYDLMVAATWSKEFDLNEKAEYIAATLEPKGFGDLDGNTILKCLAVIHYGSIQKDEVINLRKIGQQEINQLVDRLHISILKAVDILSTEFKIYSWDFLPYEAHIIILIYILSRSNILSSDHIKRIRQWFWRTSFTERYRGAEGSFISRDIELIKEFIVNLDPKNNADIFGQLPSEQSLSRVVFRKNNSRSRAFILMLASLDPRNITNGARIDTSDALSSFNKKQFHHIYPTAFLKRNKSNHDSNSLINICILAASENLRISDRDPQKYLPECIEKLGSSADEIFDCNLLPSPQKFDYSVRDYSDFLTARLELVHALIDNLYSGNFR